MVKPHPFRVAVQDSRRLPPAEIKPMRPLYQSPEWRDLINKLIKLRGRVCQLCCSTEGKDGKPIFVFGDHIKELKDGGATMDPDNIQLLCAACHNRKTREAARGRLLAVPLHEQGNAPVELRRRTLAIGVALPVLA